MWDAAHPIATSSACPLWRREVTNQLDAKGFPVLMEFAMWQRTSGHARNDNFRKEAGLELIRPPLADFSKRVQCT